MAVKPIPDGYHTVTPFLNVKGVAKLIDFLKQALGAEEVMRMPGPDGTVMHAEVSIGNSRLMLGEPMQQSGPSTSSFYVYVSDVDSMYKRATGAGDRGWVWDPSRLISLVQTAARGAAGVTPAPSVHAPDPAQNPADGILLS